MTRKKKDNLIMGLYTTDEMNMRNDAIFELGKEFLPRIAKVGKDILNSLASFFEPTPKEEETEKETWLFGDGSSPPPSPSPTETENPTSTPSSKPNYSYELPDFMSKRSPFGTRPRIAELEDEEELDALKPPKPHSERAYIHA